MEENKEGYNPKEFAKELEKEPKSLSHIYNPRNCIPIPLNRIVAPAIAWVNLSNLPSGR